MIKKRQPKDINNLARKNEQMYNAHPFPQRSHIPEKKSDERYHYIYQNFLNIPIADLRDQIFLDAGCGTGDNTWAWRRMLHPSNTVVGIDLSKTSVSIARQVNEATQSPRFGVGSLLNFGLADHSVDFILCSGVLVAIPDPDQAFQELARVLKPGGYMVIILYHQYGRAIHGLRRAIINALEPDDIERRIALGKLLFSRSMRRAAQQENTPFEAMLYDQIGLISESRYLVSDALRWFDKHHHDYLGCWPPVDWSQFGKGFRFSKDFAWLRESPVGNLILQLFPEESNVPHTPPNWQNRLSMEILWGLKQNHLFAISGRKKDVTS